MLAFQKQKVNKERLTAIIADLYTAHNLPIPADFECKSAASAVVGTVEIDGLTWPVWRAEYSARPSVVWVTHLTGKLEMIPGITTHCGLNSLCVERMKNGSLICNKCFAEKTLARYDAADEHAALNTLLLAFHRVPADLTPLFINCIKARIEPFGDAQNAQQVENMFTIADANPQTFFGYWTKNPGYIAQVLKTRQRPANVSFIYSDPYLNGGDAQPDADLIRRVFPFIDHRFTVYTPDYIDAHDTTINCGARCCGTCGACYTCGGSFEIHEKQK